MKTINHATLMRWHLWIGLILCLPLIAWSLSGVLHPIMSRVKPVVVQHHVPPLAWDRFQLKSQPKQILNQLGITRIHHVSLVQFKGNTWYRIQHQAEQTENNVTYIHSQTGEVLAHGDQQYAQWLARFFSGEQQAAITDVRLVHQFSPEYPAINRLLPVWRVEFERSDGLRAFVDTSSSRLGKLVDTKTYLFKQFFFWFHDWSFLQSWETLRITLLSGLCFLSFVGGVTGLWLYTRRYRRYQKPDSSITKIKQYHRVMGLTFSIALLMFSASGVLHALSKLDPDTRHLVMDKTQLHLADLSKPIPAAIKQAHALHPSEKVSMYMMHNAPVIRLQHKGSTEYLHANTGKPIANAEAQYAMHLASVFAQLPTKSINNVEKITHFTSEYGFINKRLPVWKLSFNTPNHPRYYIEASTGHLAAYYNDITAMERFSFTYLHKFGVFDALGRNTRDTIMALSSFALIVVSILGCLAYLKRRKRNI